MLNYVMERNSIDLLLIGVGPMSSAYAAVIKSLGIKSQAVGRNADRASVFASETNMPTSSGGLKAWLQANTAPTHAIVAVGIEALEETATSLIEAGCRFILLEKPGAMDGCGVRRLSAFAEERGTSVQIAFNRRYYSSVATVRELVAEDGGASSAFFDFTELSHRVSELPTAPEIKRCWFFANSLHVVDLAFHLIGQPFELKTIVSGSLPWHPAGAQFSGCGISDRDIVFSYRADWGAPGRWRVEIFTPKRKLTLCPLEGLRVQTLGNFSEETVELDDSFDVLFKPGLYRQVEAWVSGQTELACNISDFARSMSAYELIGGYLKS